MASAFEKFNTAGDSRCLTASKPMVPSRKASVIPWWTSCRAEDTGEKVMRHLRNPEMDASALSQIPNVAQDSVSRIFGRHHACAFGKESW